VALSYFYRAGLTQYFSKIGLFIPIVPFFFLRVITLRNFNKSPYLPEQQLLASMVLLFLISIACCYWFSTRNEFLPFYYMPARFWEIALGAIVYLLSIKSGDMTKYCFFCRS